MVFAIGIISFFFWYRRRKSYQAVISPGATPNGHYDEATGTFIKANENWNPAQGPVELQETKWNAAPRPAPVELHDTTAPSPYEPYRRSELPSS